MPLLGEYEWTEKKDQIKVSIPLHGASPSSVDVFVTSSVLKVNYSPYLIEMVLKYPIDSLRHKASIKNGVLVVTLFKAVPQIWGHLIASKETQLEQKLIGEKEQAELEKALVEKRRERRTEDERFSTKKQMALDQKMRVRIEDLKAEEKHAAEREMYAAFEGLQRERKIEKPLVVAGPETREDEEYGVHDEKASKGGRGARERSIFNDGDVLTLDEEEEEEEHSSAVPKEQKEHLAKEEEDKEDLDQQRFLPPPRSFSSSSSSSSASENKVGVTFTPRIFPTPLRESKASEEGDWVAKNRRHLKRHGVLGKAVPKGNGVDISEEDPVWLKAKGDDFFRAGDFLSAINAYSAAIDVDELNLTCFSNRSACYLKLNQLYDCKADCTVVIDALTLRAEESLSSGDKALLLKLLLRRGIANCSLGFLEEGLSDYKATKAMRIKVEDSKISLQEIEDDIAKLLILIEADKLKRRADLLLSQSEAEQAVQLYSQALQVLPVHVGCLANRATSYLALGDLQKSIEDANAAVSILREDEEVAAKSAVAGNYNATGGLSMLASILPPLGSQKRKEWKMKVLAKRGAAFAQQGQLDDAIRDYAAVSALDPSDAGLKSDLNRLNNLRMARGAPAPPEE